jgi:ABC-type multidrug transport system fused ATPase/permease subunit
MPANHLSLEQTKVRTSRNWLLIRALRLQERERARYARACRDYFKASVESFFFANLGLAVTPLFAVLVLAATTISRQWIFHTPPAEFVAFLYLFIRFQYLVAHGSHLVGGLFTSGPAVTEASRFISGLSAAEMETALACSTDTPLPANPSFVPPVSGAAPAPPRIEAQEVSFRWNPEDRPVLDGLSFRCQAGGQLGVMGPNGSGKSTLLALLLGALAQEHGRLTLDGVAAADWVAQHAQALSYAGAEAFLTAGSVRDNLVYGLDKPWTDEGLLEAVERAGLDNCIRTLPNGLDHMLTEDGGGLSSGEKQKLALARALLRSPSLLLLDEPTANVDGASENDIVETLGRLRGRCTVVVVSHEPRVLRYADETIVLSLR